MAVLAKSVVARGWRGHESKRNHRMKRVVVVAGVLLLSVGAVVAQQDVVKQTQAQMKATGRAIGGTLSPMAKGDKPYDQTAVDEALKTLDETARKLPTLFPESSKGVKLDGDYHASPKVWEDKAGFTAKINDFAKVVSEAKAKIKDLDSLKATVPGIGKACGACHETFRVKNS